MKKIKLLAHRNPAADSRRPEGRDRKQTNADKKRGWADKCSHANIKASLANEVEQREPAGLTDLIIFSF